LGYGQIVAVCYLYMISDQSDSVDTSPLKAIIWLVVSIVYAVRFSAMAQEGSNGSQLGIGPETVGVCVKQNESGADTVYSYTRIRVACGDAT
jgi:hypothetical protein